MDEFVKVSYLIAPLIVGLILHGLAIKFGWFKRLARPLDRGATFRGKRLFGDNKTYRGIVAVALGTAVGFGIQTILHRSAGPRHIEMMDYRFPAALLLGLAVGATAMLSELPNSFIKRQLNVAPGSAAAGLAGGLFYFLDQVDMLAGVWLVLCFVVRASLGRILWSILFLFVVHQIITLIGYGLGMRATAR